MKKILIVGTGVIGCVYGWQLSQTGCTVTHFVRKGNKAEIDADGIIIRCLDTRNNRKSQTEILYKPRTEEEIENEGRYDLIIVPVKVNQISSVLPLLAKTDTTILFLQNLWMNHIQLIEEKLADANIVYGQAHIAGGGKQGNTVTCTIFGSKNAHTMLGVKNGCAAGQVNQISEIMARADLNPYISKNIAAWLLSHYAEANGLIAGVMEAGAAKNYVSGKAYIRHSVKMIRERFKVCSALGLKVWRIYPQVLYYFPMWCLAPVLQKMYSTDESQLMIENHIKHSPNEMKQMFIDVMNTGESLHIAMPCYARMKKYTD